jgi:GTP:adenosylcobinamide-phosphate guanylyltransferase
MDAVVTAGGRPLPNEGLYELTRGGYKAMLEIAGKPMIQWVLDALSTCSSIGRVIVVGMPPYTNLDCVHPLTIQEDNGGMLQNVRAGMKAVLEQNPSAETALFLSSDIPAITPEAIQWVVDRALETNGQLLYPVINREVMEKRFPTSKRTYLHLKDCEVCGADVMAIRTELADDNNPIWQKIIASRKNPIQQASLLGFDTLFMILARQLPLSQAGAVLGKRLGITGQAILCPFAEAGMDVDKPNQYYLVESDLARLKTA